MNLRTVACAAALLAAADGHAPSQVATGIVPRVDHHQHLLSPMLARRWSEMQTAIDGGAASGLGPVTADRLIAQLDEAGIQRAAVLSLAYPHGSPSLRGVDEYVQVRGENDWTSQQ